jgi:hypothetical protein
MTARTKLLIVGGYGSFGFNVEISHLLAGKIVSYKGWLERLS